jgi:hypothetical protein
LEEIIEENEKIFRANYGEDVLKNPLIEVLRAVINPLKSNRHC